MPEITIAEIAATIGPAWTSDSWVLLRRLADQQRLETGTAILGLGTDEDPSPFAIARARGRVEGVTMLLAAIENAVQLEEVLRSQSDSREKKQRQQKTQEMLDRFLRSGRGETSTVR